MQKIEIVKHNATKRQIACKKCGSICNRHSKRKRKVAGLNFKMYEITFSIHYCLKCNKYFSSENVLLTGKGNRFTEAAQSKMVEAYEGRSLESVCIKMMKEHGIKISVSTLYDIIKRRVE